MVKPTATLRRRQIRLTRCDRECEVVTLSVGFVGAGGIASIHVETLDAAIGGDLSGFDDEAVDVEFAPARSIIRVVEKYPSGNIQLRVHNAGE